MSSMELRDALASAISRGDASQVQLLICRDQVDVNARMPRHHQSPPALVHAVQEQQPTIVAQLLSAGARVDDADELGLTALHVAVLQCNVELVRLLLAHRPNLDQVDALQQTVLQCAIAFESDDGDRISMLLIEAGASLAGLTSHAQCRFAAKSTAAIQALLNRGVAVGQLRGIRQATPLHLAAARTHNRAVFDMLVRVCGIDVDARNVTGGTCAHVAAERRNFTALQWCADVGADLNCATHDDVTPLHVVSDYDCAVLLLAAGADVHARAYGGAAIDAATGRLATPIVFALLACGADPDVADRLRGETARQVWARRGVSLDDAAEIESARRDVSRMRINCVRSRALQVCVGLQPLGLDALQICEILVHACGRAAPLLPFHIWWKIATTVKHKHKHNNQEEKK